MIFSKDDLLIIFQKLAQPEYLARINPLALTGSSRVRSRWNRTPPSLRYWGQIPIVHERINQRISGLPNIGFREFVCGKYFNDGRRRIALSLGCGAGGREIDWAKLNVFDSITGMDISPNQIHLAQTNAVLAGVSERVHFVVGDVNSKSFGDQKFDVIIFEHSLHHFKDIANLLQYIKSLLKPGGYLLLDEYVGPTRFQWTKRQIMFADEVLKAIPEKFRRIGSRVKSRNLLAGELLMWLNDPSEAIESDSIRPEVERQFKVLQRCDYGGTLSHLIFHDIAFNFATKDAEALFWAKSVLDIEEILINKNILTSDFSCYVCTN